MRSPFEKTQLGRGVLKGGGSARGPEGRGAGGSSPTLESSEEASARLWRAESWRRQRDCG